MGITIKNLSFGYKKPLLNNLNIDFQEGKWHFIIGSTGTGKSTFLQSISYLIPPISGEVSYMNYPLHSKEGIKKFREDSGIIFQYTDKQFFNPTIKDEILFNLKRREKNLEVIEKKFSDILTFLNIPTEIIDRSPFEISDGQKRMIALASILITDPKILILDEPTVGLDIESRDLFFSVIQKWKESGVTIIQISHFMEEVLKYGDTVTIFSKGKGVFHKEVSVLLNSDIMEEADLETPDIFSILDIFKKYDFNFKTKVSNSYFDPINLVKHLQEVKNEKI